MPLIFSILIGLLVLIGLVATFMTVKHWHWAQMLLMLGVYLSAVGVLFLGAEVVRIHKLLRMNIPKIEGQIEQLARKNNALATGSRVPETIASVVGDLRNPETVADELAGQQGKEQLAEQLKRLAANEHAKARLEALLDEIDEAGALPSLESWNQKNQVLARQRGRVWRLARKAGGPDASGQVQAAIPEPRPHGIEQGAVVYVFETGEPNANAPQQGAQYLGEFRVTGSAPDGVTLTPVLPLDQRTAQRLARSQAPWSIYETMPADRHELFGSYKGDEWTSLFTEDELRRMAPAATVEEYVRHGGPVTDDDDDFHKQAFNEEGLPIGPESDQTATTYKYDRPLRAYELLFNQLASKRAQLRARLAAEAEDIKKLNLTLEQAGQLQAERDEEKRLLSTDQQRMMGDLTTIRNLSETIAQRLTATKDLLQNGLRANAELAAELTRRQLAALGLSAQ